MNKIETGDVLVFSLLNGSEIIAKVEGCDVNDWHLESSIQFVVQQNGKGENMIGMAPSAHFGDLNNAKGQVVTIPRTAVAMYYKPSKEIETKFLTQVSGIILPNG